MSIVGINGSEMDTKKLSTSAAKMKKMPGMQKARDIVGGVDQRAQGVNQGFVQSLEDGGSSESRGGYFQGRRRAGRQTTRSGRSRGGQSGQDERPGQVSRKSRDGVTTDA